MLHLGFRTVPVHRKRGSPKRIKILVNPIKTKLRMSLAQPEVILEIQETFWLKRDIEINSICDRYK
jgi:hypothetical protein